MRKPGGDANDANSANAQLARFTLCSGAVTCQCNFQNLFFYFFFWGWGGWLKYACEDPLLFTLFFPRLSDLLAPAISYQQWPTWCFSQEFMVSCGQLQQTPNPLNRKIWIFCRCILSNCQKTPALPNVGPKRREVQGRGPCVLTSHSSPSRTQKSKQGFKSRTQNKDSRSTIRARDPAVVSLCK